MAIPDDYRAALNAWAGESGRWYANWPIAEAHALGEMGRMHGDAYAFEGQSRIQFDVDPSRVTLDSWSYQSSRDMSVRLGINATVPGFEFLGNANAGIKAEFGSAAGVYLSASGARIDRVAEVSPLRQELLARGQEGSLPHGSALVLATLTADKALILTSHSRGASFEARATANVTVVPSVPADLAGNLSVVSGAAAVDVQDYSTNRVVLAMRLLVLVRRGWLWWRHLEALGAVPKSRAEQLDLLEAMSDDADYLTLFDRDRF